MLRAAAMLVIGMGMSGAAAQGQAGGRPDLLVVNQGDRDLSLVNATAGRTIKQVPVGGVTGHEVAVSPDGRTAYVPVYGDSGVGRPGTDGRSMAVIDLGSGKVTSTVDFGEGVRPHCPVFDRNRNLLYVTTELRQSVSVVDPKTLRVVGEIPTKQAESHMLAVSHDGRHGYTANVGPGTVSVLDMETRKLVAVIPVSASVQRISISRDDRTVFTADQTKPQMAVIDAATNKVKGWVTLPALGYGTASTQDGRYLLVTIRTTNQVAVIDLRTMQVVRSIDVGKTPVEILVRPDGKAAYISCTADGTVAVLQTGPDVEGWTVSGTIAAGKLADGLAWVK